MLLEVCVDSLASARAAIAGGADRLELCSALLAGGLTPYTELLRQIRHESDVAVRCLIRPRAGDFLYMPEEIEMMCAQITELRSAGANGFVIGCLNPDGTLDRASMQTIINPDDLNAVEAALALKDELGCKVVAFTMGPPPAEGMLRELMAMGVDEGVLVTAREFGGSDTYATSQIIAAAIDTYGIEKDDIILAGRQAIDGDTAQVGPQIAEKLHLPQVTYAGEITKDGDTLTVKRMLEDGYMTIKVKTPCMITCIKELNTPRYLSVGGAFECYSKPLVTMTYETLKDHPLIDKSTIGLAGSPTNILTSFTPPQKGAGMMLEGADKATTDKLAGILAAKHII